jgi:hypothetical protein
MSESAVDRISRIAQGFGQGLQNYQQGQQNQEAKALQAEALRRQQAQQNLDAAVKIAEMTGRQTGPEIGASYYAGTYNPESIGNLPFTKKALKEQAEIADLTGPIENSRDFKKAVAIAAVKAGGKKEQQPAQNEFAAAGYSKRARQAMSELAALPEDTGTGMFGALAGMLPGPMKPEKLQLYEQAKRNFISANLRKESGAAISDAEYANEDKKYFGQPGDTPAVLAQKARSREQAALNLEGEGGRALAKIGTAQTPHSIAVGQQTTNTANAGPIRDPKQAYLKSQQTPREEKEKALRAKGLIP